MVDNQGKKVGKTTGNALFLNSDPKEFFGGIMAFPDETIELGFEILTLADLKGLSEKIKKDPLKEKLRLAYEVVKILWGEEKAQKAQQHFKKTFQKGKPEYKETVTNRLTSLATITPLVGSKTRAKRLIREGAVDINEQTNKDPQARLKAGDKIKIGKKRFVQVK